ncbi:hypothetical protein [Trinickia soli]|uniref:hypothetical protein n=1 Tax=Trinickia soli TaxID=380675 RepID=UPI00125AA102|nr:hypothetical protein CIW54_16435 [Paraburkholderia sp. T12-10]
MWQSRGFSPLEVAIGALVGLIAIAYIAQLLFVHVPWGAVLYGALVTMAPALIVVALGLGVTRALVLSQVVLSMTVPMPMLALIVMAMNALLLMQAWPF